jgi:Uma2 family endonuclease
MAKDVTNNFLHVGDIVIRISVFLLQSKIQEYMDNQVRLGWLIDPQSQQVEIYRLGHAKEVRSLPTVLSGEDVLPDFSLHIETF